MFDEPVKDSPNTAAGVTPEKMAAPQKKRVNVLDVMKPVDVSATLEVVRLSENEVAVIAFTPEGENVTLHYCDDPDINGYVQCNGDGCALCLAGKKKEQRVLLPVYVPTAHAVGVLPVSTSLRPNALMPLLQPVLAANKPTVAFLKKDGPTKFVVSSSALPPDADGGEAVTVPFLTRWEAGEITLESAFQKIPNAQLKLVPSIARLLELKGISVR